MAKVWIDDGSDIHAASAEPDCAEGELIEPLPIPVTPPPMRTRYTDRLVRPSSNFVAQLMAIDGGYPQTRDSNRAEPGHANAAYRSTTGHAFTAPPTGFRTQRMS
ncbi:hypothetical protein [Rhodopseudomonas palustris]|uniref:hypothetical protein n=1 Tax=Rhodopseudomonas palustris TaxID=1076 RepID=UPI0021F2AB55|nr:hypothetical protein [Rhodopseudomonas palustris]UYO54356.1 hypothetical protein KQX61_02730 [Rhodopseudomonas palustris]